MNVLILDNEREWRGGQEQIFTLIRGLNQRGIGVALLSPNGRLSERVAPLGVRHIAVEWHGELALALLPVLRRILRERRWDTIHFNTPAGVAVAAFLSRRAGVPVRVLSRRVDFPLRNWLSRLKYLYAADKIITVSGGVAATLAAAGIPADRVEVVYEGVDIAEIEGASPRRLFPVSDVVIGCVAFLSREKGHAPLLRAFSQLHRRRPLTRLVLVGSGPLQSSLEAQAHDLGVGDAVRFLGFQEDVSPFLRGFDLFVLPSLSEGLSSAILGAMAASLPVVASDVGGIPEVVRAGVTGLLVPPGEPGPLADALQRLVDNPSLRVCYGAAGRQRVQQQFTLAQKIEKTISIYQSLLRRSAF